MAESARSAPADILPLVPDAAGAAATGRASQTPGAGLDDEQLLERYAFPAPPAGPDGEALGTWVRMNFVASLDGAVTREGRAGGLGDAADRRVFTLLRRLADVILVGAGTVRIEGYGAMRLAEEDVAWRTAHDLPPQPVFALISRSLDLDPASDVFTGAPVRPIICTVHGAPAHRRAALSEVADVVDTGEVDVDPRAVREALAERGLRRIHGEGGPHLFGSFRAAGAVDELCLTISPLLTGGDAGRIISGAPEHPTPMRLESVLRAGDELLLRCVRVDETDADERITGAGAGGSVDETEVR